MSREPASTARPRRRLGIRVRRIEGDLHVAVRDSSVVLSESGEFLFSAIDGARPVAELAEMLASEYGIPYGEALADTVAFIEQSRVGGLLEVDE